MSSSHADELTAAPEGAGGNPPRAPLQAPLDGCVQVTPDGGVLKMVLQEGYGEVVPRFARCFLHYVGRITATGDVFMDSQQDNANEAVQAVAGRESQPREVGLSLALATMRAGEHAAVYINDPKYGYGEKGSFSFPCVPGRAKLVYEVELCQWEAPEDEEGQERSMLYEDIMERAERSRIKGNELFAQGMYREALGKYSVALSYLDEDFLMQCEGLYLDKAHEVKLPIHLNMAACQLQTGDNQTAIYNCAQALALDPGNVKALYRRARAKHALGQTDGALADLDVALKRSPGDAAVLKEHAAVRATLKRERAAQTALFKGRLGSAPRQESPSQSAAPAAADAAGAVKGSAVAPPQPDEAGGLRRRPAATATDSDDAVTGSASVPPAPAAGDAPPSRRDTESSGLGGVMWPLDQLLQLLRALIQAFTAWLSGSSVRTAGSS